MNGSDRILRCLVALLAPLAAGGCDILSPDRADAEIEIDARVVRRIVYPGPGVWEPIREITTQRLDDITCLTTTPQGCWVEESITATLYNTGTRPLRLNDCQFPLQRYGLGTWHWVMGPYPCISGPEHWIRPGAHQAFPVSVDGAPAGLYRVSFGLWDGQEVVSSRLGVSAPFQLEPLPDSPRFRCPTDDRAELARRLAREALEAAAAGELPGPLRDRLLIERDVPGFGGVYDQGASLVAWLTDLARADQITAAVRAKLGRDAVARKGEYSYSELLGWTQALGAIGVLGVWGAWVNEGTNRIHVRIANELVRPEVDCFLTGIGVPEGMARVERH